MLPLTEVFLLYQTSVSWCSRIDIRGLDRKIIGIGDPCRLLLFVILIQMKSESSFEKLAYRSFLLELLHDRGLRSKQLRKFRHFIFILVTNI